MARSGNPDPHQARLAKASRAAKAKPDGGDLTDLRRCLWLAVAKCTKAIKEADGMDDETRKTVHALTQAAGVYVRLLEVVDLEARISALEGKT